MIRRLMGPGTSGFGGIALAAMGTGCPAAAGAADWWDPNGDGLCIWAAYQPKGAASLLASYTDLSGNGNDCAPGVAPTWDAVNGWKFNGTTQYLTTTFAPAADQSQTLILQYTNRTGGWCAVGTRGGGNNRVFWLYPQDPAGNFVGYGNTNFLNVAPLMNAGNICVAGNQGYRNGAADGGAIALGLQPLFPPYIGARNNAGAVDHYCAVYEQALALYDCTLTAPQVLSVSNAMSLL